MKIKITGLNVECYMDLNRLQSCVPPVLFCSLEALVKNETIYLEGDPYKYAILFRDLAMESIFVDPHIAYDLISIASTLRPQGEYIRNLKTEYLSMLNLLSKPEVIIGLGSFSFPKGAPFELLSAFNKGTYEKDELRLLTHAISDGDRILELGAGIGFLGVNACKLACLDSYTAVEANPSLVSIIDANIETNDVSFEVLNLVLSNSDGEIDFYVTPAFWASSLIRPDNGDYEIVKVKVCDKNKIIRNVNPNFLIVDIEGGELSLLSGLDLSGVSKIIIEQHPQVLGDSDISEILTTLLNSGFILDYKNSTKTVQLWYRKKNNEL